MRRIFWKLAAAVALALVVPLAFPDLGLLVPYVMVGAAVGAKLEFTQGELDALLERAVTARETKEWEEKVLTSGGSLRGGLAVLEAERAPVPPRCAELCRMPDPIPGWVTELERGDVYEKHPGDYEPDATRWRWLTNDEAAMAVPIQVGLRVREELLNVRKELGAKTDLLSEDGRLEEMISSLERRRLEITEEVEKAERRIVAAKDPIDKLFSGWSAERRRAAIVLAQKLENRRAASVPSYRGEQSPVSLPEYEITDAASGSPKERA